MVNTKISALPAAGALTGTEQFPVVQTGVTKVATLTQLVQALQSGLLPDVPEWQPNTTYTANTFALNPAGQIVQANTTFTSGGSYNPANWTVITLTVAGVQALIAAQAASDSATYPTFAVAAQTYLSRYASAATKAATAPLLGKLKRGVQDAVELFIGDSTGNETIEHFYLELVDLAARFPAYTVRYALWDDTAGAYGSFVTVQTGTGSQTLTVYNCSVPGKAPSYVLGSRWAAAVAAITGVDLIFISHGHNMGDPTPNANGGVAVRWNYLAFLEELTNQHPAAGIVLMSQNPTYLTGRETWQAKKAQVLQEIAAQRGYGFIDVHQAFQDTGNPSAYVKTDLVHPTTSADTGSPNGSRLWADVVGAALVYSGDAGVVPRQQSSLISAAANLAGTNTAFASWGGTNPDGFSPTNATLSKDTTNFETGTYGLQITAGGSAGEASAVLTDSASFGNAKRMAGRWVTASARVFVPNGYTGTPSLVLTDVAGASQSARVDVGSDTRGRYSWLFVSKRIIDPGTFLSLKLAARLSGSDVGSITVDRWSIVEGTLPRDVVTGTPGPAGATGTAGLTQKDYLSTFGTEPMIALYGVSGTTGVQAANQAVLMRVKPPRDISVARLDWVCGVTGGNYDIGIYTAAGTRLWSKGSTTTPAAGAFPETVSPAVAMTAGTEYLVAFTFDNTTATFRGLAIAFAEMAKQLTGAPSGYVVGSAFPLPATIAPGTSQATRLPYINVREA